MSTNEFYEKVKELFTDEYTDSLAEVYPDSWMIYLIGAVQTLCDCVKVEEV